MKFLLYSECGEGAQILKKIESEGNECSLYIHDSGYKSVFDGLLNKTDNPDSFIDKDTIIIFDMSGNGAIAEGYRKAGHAVFGASKFHDDLEKDREFGFDVMRQCGIQLPEYKEFTSFRQGMDYVRQANKKLVFKPSGSMPCKLTYCSESMDELLSYMQFVEKYFGSKIHSFVLQEFIEGTVVSSEFFCNGKKFLEPPNHTVENKKFMNDNLGPSTGCSGNITWVEPVGTEIIDSGVARAEDICISEQLIGQIDLNAVVTANGIYGLEWTPRFGYDATPTLLALLQDDFGKFFSSIAKGEDYKPSFSPSYAGGVRVTIPPYPVEIMGGKEKMLENISPNKGVPILNYEEFEKEIYFYEVSSNEETLVHSGGTGVIGCVMGISDDPEKSLERPYEILEKLVIPDKQYRTDLVEVLTKDIKEVKKNG
jgi:phosphoribosylamine--glycine ligase